MDDVTGNLFSSFGSKWRAVLNMFLRLLRPTLGPYVAVILGDLRRFKATLGKFGQNVVRLKAI